MDSVSLAAVLTMAIIGVVLSFGGAYLISFLRSPRRAVEGPEAAETHLWMEAVQRRAPQQRQAFREMVQEMMNTYMQLLNTPDIYLAGQVAPGTYLAGQADQLPIEGYDELTVEEVSGRLDGLSAEELRVVRDYEGRNKNRVTILEQLDRRIREKLRSEAAEHAQQMREEVVNQLNASMDARFNDLLGRVEEGLTAHAVAQAAANRYSFWLSCGANFVFFVLGAIASAVTTLVVG